MPQSGQTVVLIVGGKSPSSRPRSRKLGVFMKHAHVHKDKAAKSDPLADTFCDRRE